MTCFRDKEKPEEVRQTNIEAAKAVADAVRTSLGPRGLDKMITAPDGNVTISNDGATILDKMSVLHPAAKMLVELSHAQDVEAGDGTTSVVVLAGSLLSAAQRLLRLGIHSTIISESFQNAAAAAVNVLKNMSINVDLNDRATLIKSAITSLSSKVVAQYSNLFAPIAVEAVLRAKSSLNVDLKNIRIVKKVGGTVEDTELVNGLVLNQGVRHLGSIPTKVEKAKVGLIQFCLSAPKTDIDNQVLVSDYAAMDRVFQEERLYILNLCKQIKKSGCNVLLVQKSILRDAVNDLSLHILSKMKVMVITDIERDEVEFICKTLGCKPVANPSSFTSDKLGSAELVEEIAGGSFTKFSDVPNPGNTCSILMRASNKLVLEEAERSLHDALCVIRCLVKENALIAGGGAPEIQISVELRDKAQSMIGMDGYCFQAFAEAMEIIPLTLAENAGLNPISVVTELRNRHHKGEINAGINVKKGTVKNITEDNVLQPLLVSTCAVNLAAETVCSILKIDDVLFTR
ncbi:T-complex protein 1 subunit delta-like [Zophobas morio]|jgi:T-complex protein 1 subunit delta|uniref:T-complex protein 1 subunit delta-like n=1 Tax=Zophobas morio TaxID=2755281 RepID=UPI003083041C